MAVLVLAVGAWLLAGVVFKDRAQLDPAPGATAKAVEQSGHSAPSSESFVPLFNGKDLAGWFIDLDDPKTWGVEQEVIVARGTSFNRLNYLLTERDYGDFILRLDFNLDDHATSGVVLRAVPGEVLPHPYGSRLQEHPVLMLVDQPTRSEVTGTLHWVLDRTHARPGRMAELSPPRSWNQIGIEMRGRSLRATVNNKPVLDTTLAPDARFADGTIPALNRPRGRIGLLKHSGTARFRNIMIQELPNEPAPIKAVEPATVPGGVP
jgi:hypothetical protein